MIHAAPQVDFSGVALVESLEVGIAKVNGRSAPAVRFHLEQSGNKYPIMASGHVAAEIYAYCLAAAKGGGKEIHAKVMGTLLMDVGGNAVISATSVVWYTSAEMREQAANSILGVFDKKERDATRFKFCTKPLVEIESR